MAHMPPIDILPNRSNNHGNQQEFIENFHNYSWASYFDHHSGLIRDEYENPPPRLTYSSQLFPMQDSIYQVGVSHRER